LLKCKFGKPLGLSGKNAFVAHQVSGDVTLPSGYAKVNLEEGEVENFELWPLDV
jgi:hypothetical protein